MTIDRVCAGPLTPSGVICCFSIPLGHGTRNEAALRWALGYKHRTPDGVAPR